MFKKLSDMEKSMCYVMKQIITSGNCHSAINNLGRSDKNALHECLKSNYIENIEEFTDAKGNYHFQSLGNTHINRHGFLFIRNMSPGFRFKNAIFDILKGTLGFLIGVATTLSVNAVLWIIKHSEEIQEFLLHISQK